MIRFHEHEKQRLREIVPVSALRQMTALRHRSKTSPNPAIMAGVLGPVIVHKKVILSLPNDSRDRGDRETVIDLMLPAGALVHISLGWESKCRADMAVCRESGTAHRSFWDDTFVYEAGLLKPRRRFSPQIGLICGHGIHFFFRRKAAEDYCL
jgi:hypothetical protein